MTASFKSLASHPTIARVVEHARMPLYRNGYALVFSSAATSALGVLYWVLAARSYTAATVGLNSAAISTMIFLAGLAQFNLGNALNRFIPTAGRSTRHLILATYGIGMLGGLLFSAVFLLGIQSFASGLAPLFADPGSAIWFMISTMCWCVFVLQDSALTGLRQATWVPAENIIYALAKMGMLVAFAILPHYGLFVSWTLPVVLLILPVNWLIFRRLAPKHMAESEGRSQAISTRVVVHYVAGDYFSSLIWMATTSLLPLLIIERLGAEANAFFYLPWTIAYSLYLVSRNMGMSFIAEASHDESKLNLYAQRTFNQTLRIVGLIVLAVVVTAPLILSVFGKNYAAEGVQLMQLLVLSALPYVVVSQYLSLARVKRNIRALVLVQMALCVIILGLSVTLMPVMGITGVGVAWLAGQSIMAIVLLLTGMRSQWIMQVNTQPIAVLASAPSRALHRLRHASGANQFNAMLPDILASTEPLPGIPAPASWRVTEVISTVSDVKVALLGPRQDNPVALLKVATTDFAVESLERRIQTGERMWHDPCLAEWRAVLPAILARGTAGGYGYVVKQKLAGVELRKLSGQQAAFCAGQAAAVQTISQLHQRTGHLHRIGEADMKRWVHAPARVLRNFSKTNLRGSNYDRPIDSLIKMLDAALLRRELWVARIHGDFAPGNILVQNDGLKVTGLVDWEMSVEDDLPQLDVMQLLLSSRMLERRREMGDVVLGLIKNEDWSPHEQALLAHSREVTGNREPDTQALLLMCWLRQVADTVQKSKRYTTSWVWSIKNVEQVLVRL